MQLVYYGNPLLTQRSSKIKEITSEVKQLAREMAAFAEENGAGLAAVQVGKLMRLFVIRQVESIDEEKEEATYSPSIICINPKIVEKSDVMESAMEGCLSIPEIMITLDRPDYVLLEYQDLEGQSHRLEAHGYNARIILHEYDHLEGVLNINRLPKDELKELQPKLKKIKKCYS